MSDESGKSMPARGASALNEVRYSLREMMVEVASERSSGSLAAEKMHQKDIRKLFRDQPRKPREAQA